MQENDAAIELLGKKIGRVENVSLSHDHQINSEHYVDSLFDHHLDADGDFTPAVEAVRKHGKKVYVVSPASGAQLARVANSFIKLRREWFDDCYLP